MAARDSNMSPHNIDITSLTATGISAGLKAGEFKAVDVITSHLERIRSINPIINSVVTVCEDSALQAAEKLDARKAKGLQLGPLAGVPVGIKDVTDTAGIRTTYGCKLFENHIPDKDAAVVERLKQADAIIIGKTNTPEFATGANTYNEIFGATRNPWEIASSAGGSTGGGAAGLASRLFALAEGTDLGGSLRVPAAFCGVVGLRPTPGIVPHWPNATPYDTFEVEGPMARTSRDVALALSVMAHPYGPYPVSSLESDAFSLKRFEQLSVCKQKIAFVADIAGVGVEPDILQACEVAAAALAEAGHKVSRKELDLSAGRQAFTALRAQWMVNRHFLLIDQRDQLGENLRSNIEKGLSQSPRDIAAAEAVRAGCWQKGNDLLGEYDAVITPCTPVMPFPVTQNYPTEINGVLMSSYIDWVAPTFLISIIGLPAVSVPAGLTPAGMPVGLQIIGQRFDDMKLLVLADAVQQHAPICEPSIAG